MGLEQGHFWRPGAREPRVVAVFSYRYDAHLVPALLQNLAPIAHDWIAWDDRGAGAALSPEIERRRALIDAARALDGDWLLIADPDERYDDRLADRISELTTSGPKLWTFAIREMFTPTEYRADGLWGRKSRVCLYPLTAAANVPDRALHGRWLSYPSGPPLAESGLVVYHLRMIAPERRRLRRELYAAADPDREHQKIGYDYLDDERGMHLVPLGAEARYSPLHVEDGGLWSPDPGDIGDVRPDPLWTRFHYLAQLQDAPAASARAALAEDLFERATDDADLVPLAAITALSTGAEDAVARMVAAAPGCAASRLVTARLALAVGDREGAARAARAGLDLVPGNRHLEIALQRAEGNDADPAGPDATWRRWLDGPAEVREGDAMFRDAELATIVIGYRAPPTLAAAVRSLREQDHPCEIVVVNSGGGDPVAALGDEIAHVRLVAIEERLLVGAARNVGIDASRAPQVAFLAADCTARPGWVRNRLARHAAGNPAIGCAVVPEADRALSARTASLWYHWRRWPTRRDRFADRHGLSYARWLFDHFGLFPPDLQVGEDTCLNRRLYGRIRIDWAPEIILTHSYPTNPAALFADAVDRGRRRAPDLLGPLKPERHRAEILRQRRVRYREARKALAKGGPDNRLARAIMGGLLGLVSWGDALGLSIEARRLARVTALEEAARPANTAMDGDALARIRRAQALAPRLPRLWVAEADILARMDPTLPPGTLVPVLRRAFGLAPDDPAPARKLHAALMSGGRPDLALAEAARFSELTPREPLHAQNAAEAALAAGRPGEALLHARLCMAADPRRPRAHQLLAEIHVARGDAHQARIRRDTAAALEAARKPKDVA